MAKNDKLIKRWGPHNPGTVITTDPGVEAGAVLVNEHRFGILSNGGFFAPELPPAPAARRAKASASAPAPAAPPALQEEVDEHPDGSRSVTLEGSNDGD